MPHVPPCTGSVKDSNPRRQYNSQFPNSDREKLLSDARREPGTALYEHQNQDNLEFKKGERM